MCVTLLLNIVLTRTYKVHVRTHATHTCVTFCMAQRCHLNKYVVLNIPILSSEH